MSTLDKLLKEATDDFLVEGDWEKYIHICELINSIQDGDKLTAIVQQNLNNASKPRSQTRAMELLQSGMQNNFFVVRAVHRPAFQQFLVDLANSKTFEYNLKNKLLNLIRAWGVAFPANSHLPNFGRTLEFLIQKRIPFPAVSDDSNYSPPPADVEIHQPVQPARPAPYVPEPHPRQLIIPGGHPGVVQGVPVHVYPAHGYPGAHPQGYPVAAAPPGYPGVARQGYPVPGGAPPGYPGAGQPQVKLETMTISKLTELLTSQNLLRELMQAINVQLESPQDNELIKDLFQTCSQAQPGVVESISRVTDERLLSMMLQFNDAMMELTELWNSLHQQHQQAKLRPPPVAVPIIPAPAPVPVFNPIVSPPKSSAFTGLDAPIELNLNFGMNEAPGAHSSHSAPDDEDFKLPAPGKYEHSHVAHPPQAARPIPAPAKEEEVDLFADFDALVISRHKDSPNQPPAPKVTTPTEDLLSLMSGPPVQAAPTQSVPMPFQPGPGMMPYQNQPNPYPMYAMSPPGGYYQPPMNPVQPTTPMMGMPGFGVNPGNQPHPVPQQQFGNPALGTNGPVAFPANNPNVQNTPDVFKDLLI